MNNKTPLLVNVPVLENSEIKPGFFLLKLGSRELSEGVAPGRFFDIRVSGRLDILLRRPFSVYDYDEDTISILYEVVGKGTKELSLRKQGDELDVLGPLGRGFALPKPETEKVFFVGGGMGIAPLFCMAKELKQKTNYEIEVLIGARNKYTVLCEDAFKKIGLTPKIATDDGSYGYKGFVTELLKKRDTLHETRDTLHETRDTLHETRDTLHEIRDTIYACGPQNMLKETAAIMKENNIYGQLSLDRHMACGIGVCLGCVVKGSDGKYKRVCKDGPVFGVDELEWN